MFVDVRGQDVHVDQGLATSRNPDDPPAFSDERVEEVAKGKHVGQARSPKRSRAPLRPAVAAQRRRDGQDGRQDRGRCDIQRRQRAPQRPAGKNPVLSAPSPDLGTWSPLVDPNLLQVRPLRRRKGTTRHQRNTRPRRPKGSVSSPSLPSASAPASATPAPSSCSPWPGPPSSTAGGLRIAGSWNSPSRPRTRAEGSSEGPMAKGPVA